MKTVETFNSMELTNEEYHAMGGYSSSQLKDILEDPEVFHSKYITKETARESNPAFDVGTYFHTSVLEPEKVGDELAVFNGVRRGKSWDAFQKKNFGKTIITENEEAQAIRMIESVKNNSQWKDISKGSIPEYSARVTLAVNNGAIFGQTLHGEIRSANDGFKSDTGLPRFPKDSRLIQMRVRADAISWSGPLGRVIDLKSTTGNPKEVYSVKEKISRYKYDMSAMLYCDIFRLVFDINFDFYWVFASKDMGTSQVYIADEDTRAVGRAKWTKAVLLLDHHVKNGWKFEDTIIEIGPTPYDRDYLKKEDIKL